MESYRDLVKSIAERVIQETIATMMDVQPITCVGQEHPAKKKTNAKTKKKKHFNR